MILITGGSGFFGINMARILVEKGEEVLLVQRRSMTPPPLLEPYWGKQVKQALGNILDLSFLLGCVKDYGVKSIIHSAHESGGRAAIKFSPKERGRHSKEPLRQLLEVQIVGNINCLEAARLMDLRRVTFISSTNVYRGLPEQPAQFHEDAALPPVAYSEIAGAKKAADDVGFLYSSTYGISYATIRTGGNDGPGAGWAMVDDALAGRKTTLPIPSNMRMHWGYSKDTAEGTCLVHLAKSLKHHIYNVASGVNPTVQEIANTIKDVIPQANIELGPPQPPTGEYLIDDHFILDRPQTMTRMKEEFGFVPKSLKQAIEHYVGFLQSGAY